MTMERRTTTVVERLRRFTNLGLCDSDGKVSLSKEVATILEDLCGEAADMIIALREQIDKGTVITVDPKYPPFGSFDLDEVLNQIKAAPDAQDISSWPTANPTYGDNCWARLPCGICRNTMMQCPLSLMQPTWSCSSSTATNQTGGEEK